MANYIAIDGGTTNTRVYLVTNGRILRSEKINIGAKKSIGGNTELKNAIGCAIAELLKAEGFKVSDIECIMASGMITSEYGLFKLDHLVAPAGINELSRGMTRTEINDVSELPFYFIPGVKLAGGTLEGSDMMRGEETELIGLDLQPDSIYVLPGSHSKIIRTDSLGRISDFSSMLTGEMIAATVSSTILKDSVDLGAELDKEYLLKGYEYCSAHGVNESLFKVRVLCNLLKADKAQVYGFFMGVMLHDEVEQILSYSETNVVIGGRKQLREATATLVNAFSDKNAVMLTDEAVEYSTVKGMIAVYENK